ncbi:MAG TPA: sulfur carrier protein ThiS [Bacteroidales bacterium]|nr:sulfur carrier protein ThiS [Bacteroidales bacterium]HPS26224.1 sulfur carrier protein ThiS [Bacteroidales bacterium]
MNITLNNNKEVIDADQLTVAELLKIKNFTFKMLIIKINGKVVSQQDYAHTRISEGDDVIVLHLISGG